MNQLFRPDVGVHLLLIADNQILLGLRANTGFADGQWSVPGGHLEDAESLPAGASREAYEELGITICPADLAFAHMSGQSGTNWRFLRCHALDRRTGECRT